MPETKDQLIPYLHKYFMTASLMAQEFDRHLADPPQFKFKDAIQEGMMFLVSKAGIKMTLWYGSLYVVIEGWREIGMSDPEVDRLLSSPNTKLLKGVRNSAFQFQKHWMDDRLAKFVVPKDSVAWVRALTEAMRRVLLAEMRRISGRSTP
jgi:hypothetical protein